MNEWMDTVDPRIERAFTKTGVKRPVHMPTYWVRWGVGLTIAIAALSAIVIWA